MRSQAEILEMCERVWNANPRAIALAIESCTAGNPLPRSVVEMPNVTTLLAETQKAFFFLGVAAILTILDTLPDAPADDITPPN